MIIGFTGTRFGMTKQQHEAVWDIVGLYTAQLYEEYEFHHGDCVGADLEAHKICVNWNQHHAGIKIIIHPPSVDTLRAYCKGDLILEPKPYEQRNRDIVQTSDLIIAAPNTMTEQPRGGTWQTVRFAREYSKPCKIVLPNGVVVDA